MLDGKVINITRSQGMYLKIENGLKNKRKEKKWKGLLNLDLLL